MKLKNVLFAVLFCIVLCFSTNLYAEDKIVLIIDGEKYERPYPKTNSEYKELIDGLVNMYNTLSEDYREYRETDVNSSKSIKEKLAELQQENASLQFTLDTLEKNYASYKKETDKLLKTNTAMTFGFLFGPTVSINGVGTFADILFDYRLLRNLHFGLNAGISVYDKIEKLEGRLGILVGYSFK